MVAPDVRSYPALAPYSDLVPSGGAKWTQYSSRQRYRGQASVMNGFQTPDSKRSQAFKSDSGLDGSGDDGWDFLVGTAISVYQNSGGENNNWWRYERQRTRLGRPTIDVSARFRLLFPNKLLTSMGGLPRRVHWRSYLCRCYCCWEQFGASAHYRLSCLNEVPAQSCWQR